jgi:D-3-phosphoglycerate dehydrogenase
VEGIQKVFAEAGIDVTMLESYASTAELCAAVADIDGLIVRSDKVTEEVLAAAEYLQIVVRAGAGYDNIDLAACTARNIVAMNTPGQNSNAVAELAIGMMVYMLRNGFTQGTGSELKGKKLGIHGYGNVGRRVALLGKSFGMELYAFDAGMQLDNMFNDRVRPCIDEEELYATCDCISVHIPANEQTANTIDGALVSKMPIGGLLINTARKEIIDEKTLLEVLQVRTDLRYATDVAPAIHKKMRTALGLRYYATEKKMGAETTEANINAGLAAARQIVNFFTKGDKTFQINK